MIWYYLPEKVPPRQVYTYASSAKGLWENWSSNPTELYAASTSSVQMQNAQI